MTSLNNNLFTKTEKFEAQQFTGTVENTREILQWLHERNHVGRVTTTKHTELLLGKVVVSDSKVINIETQGGGSGFTLWAGGWLVSEYDRFGNRVITFVPEEQFQLEYKVV